MIATIKEYLIKNKEIRIEGLGKLYIQYDEAAIHPILNTFTPPGYYVHFKADERELGTDFADYVAQKESITFSEACDRIEKWVNHMHEELIENKSFELGHMGTFSKGNVELEFTSALDAELSPKSYGLPVFSARREKPVTTPIFTNPVIEKPIQTMIEEKPSEPETDKSQETPDTPDACETSAPATTETERQPEQEPEQVFEQPSEPEQPAQETVEEAVQEEIPDTKPVEEVSPENEANHIDNKEEETESESPKKKRHVGKILFYIFVILLLLCIIGIGIYAFVRPAEFIEKKDMCVRFATSLFSKDTDADAAVMDSEEEILPENEESEEYMETDTMPTEEILSENTSEAIPANCYLIIGGFSKAENADRLVSSLKSEYPNVSNLGLNAKGTLHMVGIGPLTRAESEQLQSALNSTYDGCWILEK